MNTQDSKNRQNNCSELPNGLVQLLTFSELFFLEDTTGLQDTASLQFSNSPNDLSPLVFKNMHHPVHD